MKHCNTQPMPAPLPPLTVADLQKEARAFAIAESAHAEPSLFGVTDGKAVGTYLEHKFQSVLQSKYNYTHGSSAKGIDFPELDVDIKAGFAACWITTPTATISSLSSKNGRSLWTRLK